MPYTLGLDYGTQSARVLVLDITTGEELAVEVMPYRHAVMDTHFVDGTPLPPHWALQHPQDYLDVLDTALPAALAKAGVVPEQVIGIGVDFTACTLLPVRADATPLALLSEWKNNPYAYVLLWKHHAAQDYADAINAQAEAQNAPWIKRYGGLISSEWAFPKMWQVAEEAPEVYAAADYFVEASDWIVWQLMNRETGGHLPRNACAAGYKGLWHAKEGFPPAAFWSELSPKLDGVLDKLQGSMVQLGSRVGGLSPHWAQKLGLRPDTAIAAGNVDAHVCVPPAGIGGCGEVLMIMGTSTCHMLCAEDICEMSGVCGVVEGGILPGVFGYEAGQACVGDHFNWAAEVCASADILQQAAREGVDVQQVLTARAQKLKPGESGLLALDWWNGNRSVLVDARLSGLMLGMTLATRPEEIYRALIEATAFGTRVIIEGFEQAGLPVHRVVAAGGIVEKNPMAMQIYADVLQRPIHIATSTQAPARGAAMFGAVAAGEAAGGIADILTAAKRLGQQQPGYQPNAAHKAVYDALYAEYCTLQETFRRGGNDVMKRLMAMRGL